MVKTTKSPSFQLHTDASVLLTGLLTLYLGVITTAAGEVKLNSEQPKDEEKARTQVARALNRAQSHIDEYGTLQVSAPVLTYVKSNDFQFSLRYGAPNYFREAKTSIQARAGSLDQAFQSFMLQGKGEMDPTQIAAYATALMNYRQQATLFSLQQDANLRAAIMNRSAAFANAATNTGLASGNQAIATAESDFAKAVFGTNGAPAFPVAKNFSDNLPGAPTNLAALLTDTNYGRMLATAPYLGLLANQPTDLQIPNRTALQQAFGDQTTERIFEVLTSSQDEGKFANKITLFGLSTVSIDPGWRTKKDWSGEVVVYAELEFHPARTEVVNRLLSNHLHWPAKVLAKIAKDYGYTIGDKASLISEGLPAEVAALIAAESSAD